MTVPPPTPDEAHGDEPNREHHWTLHRVAFGLYKLTSFPELSGDDWATINDLLSQSPYLHSIDLFCGNNVPENDFNGLVEAVRSKLPTVGDKVHGSYGHEVSDGREMVPELFGIEWRRQQLAQLITNEFSH